VNKQFKPDLEKQLVANINEAEWIELTKEMVAIGQPNSTNPLDPDIPAGEEEAIALFVAGKLESMGFVVNKYCSQTKRPNVVGVLKGEGGGPSLMINDHLDTYPAVETERWDKCDGNPFKATQHGDWIYGRGTSDTRANLAASLLAVKSVIDSGVKLKGDLVCCYTVDEEKDGLHGSIFITKEMGITTDYSITVEPTAWGKEQDDWGLNLSVANSGHCLISVTLRGIKSHIWRPDTGKNAITMASEVIPEINRMAFKHIPSEFPGHTPPCACVVRIAGGLPGEMQFTPDACELSLAVVGMLPGMSLDSIIEDIVSVVTEVTGGVQGEDFDISQIPGSLFEEGTEPVPFDEEPNRSLREAYQKILGCEPIPNRKNAFNDTIRFREAGINAVTFGPGEDGWAPINECISVKKSVAAMKIIALAIPNILGTSA
jgi:acetylornithine deacetylase